MLLFVPIKHNSQRVYRKNFRIFKGEPLYKHTLLKYCKDRVYVDTDSDEIFKEITNDKRLEHVHVFKRKEDLIGDKVSVCDLIKSFILKFNIKDPIAQIHVTSPFLSKKTVSRSYNMMGEFDSIVSCKTHQTRFWRKEEYGFCPINHNPLKLEQTQDLPVYYEESSAFYIFNPDVPFVTGNRIRPNFVLIPEIENVDIDTEDDWEWCLKNGDEK